MCLVCFFLMPPAGAHLPDPKLPVNINYVFGFSDSHPQTWMGSTAYLAVWMAMLLSCAFLPAHLVLCRLSQFRSSQRNEKFSAWRQSAGPSCPLNLVTDSQLN